MPRSHLSSVTAALALTALTAVVAAPRPASACGGTFCDAGPQSMPVDQSGESILFVMEDGWVEAHVQIDYQGDPAQFAWIVPIMAEPEVTPGSQALLQRMLDATVPTFSVDSAFEGDCNDGPRGLVCALEDAASSNGGHFIDQDPPPGADDGPYVRAQDVAGAFEYAVLQGGTVEGLGEWLDENGYARDDDAPEILQTYLDEGFMFVAFKLRPGTGVDQIHPVVLRYQGTEPCIPLRLTRIAATEDMKVRALFLGNARVVPTNWRHVELNPLQFDWTALGANYDSVVGQAVDVEGADGRAFVTEYAGASSLVSPAGLRPMGWSSEAFLDATTQTLSETLRQQQLIRCDFTENELEGEVCVFTHPLVLPLLRAHFPSPPDVSADDFFLCTDCYPELADESRWDHAGFVAAFEEQVVGPAEHAVDVLGAHGYLTRLYTVISPHEMTTDPLFHERADLPTVSNQWLATRVFHCEDHDRFELADGTVMYLDDENQQPSLPMSSALRVEEIPLSGAPMVLFDASEDIARELAASNEANGPSSGCACRASRRRAHGAGWLGLLLLLGLRARGRRRR